MTGQTTEKVQLVIVEVCSKRITNSYVVLADAPRNLSVVFSSAIFIIIVNY